MRVLVTGATGFIGSRAVTDLRDRGLAVRATVRRPCRLHDVETSAVGDLAVSADWSSALRDVDVVLHLANRAHMPNGNRGDDPAYHAINVSATMELARQAQNAGVRRFVFVSSTKVFGDPIERSFREDDPCYPVDAYGRSKLQAEEALRRFSSVSRLELVVVRPPLVYGPRVKANFLRLLEFVALGLPWPFGRLDNRRSLVFVGNLTAALAACCIEPAAAGRTYLVSDGVDISTPELLRRLAKALGKRSKQLPLNGHFTAWLARQLGAHAITDRVFGSLVVDSGAIRRELGWMPPYSVEEGLSETARWYRSQRR